MSGGYLLNSANRFSVLVVGLALIAGCSPGGTAEPNVAGANEAGSTAKAVRSTGTRFSAEELQGILQEQDAATLSQSLNKVKKLGASRDALKLLE
jgi:hypothetical protein